MCETCKTVIKHSVCLIGVPHTEKDVAVQLELGPELFVHFPVLDPQKWCSSSKENTRLCSSYHLVQNLGKPNTFKLIATLPFNVPNVGLNVVYVTKRGEFLRSCWSKNQLLWSVSRMQCQILQRKPEVRYLLCKSLHSNLSAGNVALGICVQRGRVS